MDMYYFDYTHLNHPRILIDRFNIIRHYYYIHDY